MIPEFSALPIARYRFNFRVTSAIGTQLYAGSALRGAFGHALRQLACVTKAKTCDACPLLQTCPYPRIFSPHEIPREQEKFTTIQQIPVPYLIEPPPMGSRIYEPGAEFCFNMVLMGSSLTQLPMIIMAWRRAFLRGLGKTEGKAELTSVVLITQNENRIVYSEEAPVLVQHKSTLTMPRYTAARDLHLLVSTPLRLQRSKKILGARDIDAGILLRNLIRRVSLLAQFQLGAAIAFDVHHYNALADQVKDERRLSWQDWSRYSTRQQQKMDLGGVQGHWLLREVPVELLPFVYLGQWVHVGKETSFGLGGYQIVEDHWQSIQRDRSA